MINAFLYFSPPIQQTVGNYQFTKLTLFYHTRRE